MFPILKVVPPQVTCCEVPGTSDQWLQTGSRNDRTDQTCWVPCPGHVALYRLLRQL